MPIIPTYAPFYIRSPKGNPPFFRGEDFLRFFPEPFPGIITSVTLITATAIIITAVTVATAIGGTFIKVKVFPFRETF